MARKSNLIEEQKIITAETFNSYVYTSLGVVREPSLLIYKVIRTGGDT